MSVTTATTLATAPPTENDWVDLSVATHNVEPSALLTLSLWGNSGTGYVDQNRKNLLVISPYNQPQHILDTTTIPKAAALLAEALAVFKPTRPDYATAAYVDSFNWDEVIAYLRELISAAPYSWRSESFYIVVFRSRSVAARDGATLGMLDMNAFEEALKAGGLLRYWCGFADSEGNNLSTCVWTNRAASTGGTCGSKHGSASKHAKQAYANYSLERLTLNINHDATEWNICKWEP
ncbi:MAG: hypothetical protein M1831_003696 [Alyxoria varia]|nr:MAG: hypothetical protein M1831_003696 [Alyxoria varia]